MIDNQLKIEAKQLPELLEACVLEYIEDYEWSFYFREVGEGVYTFITKKEKKNGKVKV